MITERSELSPCTNCLWCEHRTSLNSRDYWFGLYKYYRDGTTYTRWYDGNPSTYRNWARDEPDERTRCVSYTKDGFKDRRCYYRYYYTCKKDAGSILVHVIIDDQWYISGICDFVCLNFRCLKEKKNDSSYQLQTIGSHMAGPRHALTLRSKVQISRLQVYEMCYRCGYNVCWYDCWVSGFYRRVLWKYTAMRQYIVSMYYQKSS